MVALPKSTRERATALASRADSRAPGAVPLIWIMGASGEVSASIRAARAVTGTPVSAEADWSTSGWAMIRP